MPGIDFAEVRRLVPMSRVLELLDWKQSTQSGDELRGPCPVHGSNPNARKPSRTFAVNAKEEKFQCFKCGAHGNQLDLYAQVIKQQLFDAAKELCKRAGVRIPWIRAPRKKRRPRGSGTEEKRST